MAVTIQPTHSTPKPRRRKRGLLRLKGRFRTVGQLSRMFAGTGRWWLVPMVAVFVISAVILAVISVVQYAAPFVYSIF
ncbi:MAG: hypothetical protein ACI9MR_004256 [Myxococcota bacterium]|jgi:hypothetical protein